MSKNTRADSLNKVFIVLGKFTFGETIEIDYQSDEHEEADETGTKNLITNIPFKHELFPIFTGLIQTY